MQYYVLGAHYNALQSKQILVQPCTTNMIIIWKPSEATSSMILGDFVVHVRKYFDCRESGTSLEDVVERVLNHYKDRHPKQHICIVGIY